MSLQAINDSIRAIQDCNPKDHKYLKVVGSGAGQHLEVVQKNWFGRLLMWLGCTNACMKKVIHFVGGHISTLTLAAGKNDDAKLKLIALVGKITKYNDKHGKPKKFASVVDHIKKVSARLGKTAQQKPLSVNTSLSSSPLKPLNTMSSPESSPPLSPMSPGTDPVGMGVLSPSAQVPIDAVKNKRKSSKLLQCVLRKYKRSDRHDSELVATPSSPMPNPPFVKPGNAPEMSEKQVLNLLKNGRANVVTMNRFFLHHLDSLKPETELFNGPVFAFRMGVVVSSLTCDEIAKFVDQDPTVVDVFCFTEGSVFCAHSRLVGAIGLMNEEQMKRLIQTIATSKNWSLEFRRDAFLKITNILPQGKANDKIIDFIVAQDCFKETIINQIPKIPISGHADERACEEGEFVSDERLAAHYLKSLLIGDNQPDRLAALMEFVKNRCSPDSKGSLINSHDFVCLLTREKNKFLSYLSTEDKALFASFLLNECEEKVWIKSMLVKEIVDDDEQIGELFEVSSKDSVRMHLIKLCENIESLKVVRSTCDSQFHAAIDARMKVLEAKKAEAQAKEEEEMRKVEAQIKARRDAEVAAAKALVGKKKSKNMSAADLLLLANNGKS